MNYSTIAKELREDYPKLSDFEILSLSIQIQRNQILQSGLVVHGKGDHPAGLEAIAISLGYSNF